MADLLEDLQKSVTEAAGIFHALWLSYLFVLFYLVIAAAGVTHLDLFLENPVKLPFLSVDLPIKGFFWMGPLILLIVHAFVLLHFALLADKARILFGTEDERTPELRALHQGLLPINIFVQFFKGAGDVRELWIGRLILAIAGVSLILAPVLSMIFFELQFLPYQSLDTTWWHRIALFIDLSLLFWLWPAIIRGRAKASGRSGRRWVVHALPGIFAMLALCFVLFIATFPGELLDDLVAETWLHRSLVAGAVDANTQRPKSLWSNRLVLPALDLVDHDKFDTMAKLAASTVLHSLRGRSLQGAVLSYATVSKTDFTAANLRNASLEGLHAQGAWFDFADLSGAQLDGAEMQGASFYAALLEATSLGGAQLQGGKLAAAQMQGAWLGSADLAGASLSSADLRRATLDGADLRGSDLHNARLQGASLAHVRLGGASFDKTYLWRAEWDASALVGPPKPFISSLQRGPADAPCEGLPQQSCTDGAARIRQLVDQYARRHAANPNNRIDLADEKRREEQIAKWRKRLGVSLSAGATEPDESNDGPQNDPVSLGPEDEGGLEKFWVELACAGKGAPFVLGSLIDMLGDANVRTVPHSPAAQQRLLRDLLGEGCTAKPLITDAMRMQIEDVVQRHRPEAAADIVQQAPL